MQFSVLYSKLPIVMRTYGEMAKEVNRMMRNDLPSNVKSIDNTNISEKHLNSSGLHLNQRGSGALALNYITYIRSVGLS